MRRNTQRIQRSRKKLSGGLEHLGYHVYPSQANFVLARKDGESLRNIYEELKQRKILVRYFDFPDLRDCLRITVGTPSEVKILLKELAVLTR